MLIFQKIKINDLFFYIITIVISLIVSLIVQINLENLELDKLKALEESTLKVEKTLQELNHDQSINADNSTKDLKTILGVTICGLIVGIVIYTFFPVDNFSVLNDVLTQQFNNNHKFDAVSTNIVLDALKKAEADRLLKHQHVVRLLNILTVTVLKNNPRGAENLVAQHPTFEFD
jgi:hypothetical protein